MPLRLSLCLHNHQPVGNFDNVVERAYRECYLPLLECISRHPGIRLGMHHSGCLLEWIGKHHPEYVSMLSALSRSGRIELLSSGYYEPLLPIFRRQDIRSQIGAFSSLLEGISGSRPAGIWLTERVWEPSIPSLLAGTGISWSVVDDSHLLQAGVHPSETGRPWITEDCGSRLVLLGSSKKLRYAIPFGGIDSVMDLLRRMEQDGVPLAFYGDDGEKFGVWPGTSDLCWGERWLDRFFDGIEGSGWLETLTPSEAVSAVPSAGPVYVPATSYAEMGEWTLPSAVLEEISALEDQIADKGLLERLQPLLRGGFWRNFLTRYPEANELHKRVLMAEKGVKASGSEEALRHFWRSQCNCPYWHGVFGGLYLPHLREAVWCELTEAERKAFSGPRDLPRITASDIDFDGSQEAHVLTGSLSTLLRTGDGLTISELTLLPDGRAPVPLGHCLTRRREAYHTEISDEAGEAGPARTIHSGASATESGLASKLVIDNYRRVSFRSLLLPAGTGRDGWFSCSPEIVAPVELQGKPLIERHGDLLVMSGTLVHGSARLEKRITVDLRRPVIVFRSTSSGLEGHTQACEICLNLLTGSESDRFVKLGRSEQSSTGSRGTGVCRDLVIEDGWRRVRMKISATSFIEAAHMPLDSVNRSEKGFERVHQGMALLLAPGASTGNVLELRMELEDLG
jgi:alpha-amylase